MLELNTDTKEGQQEWVFTENLITKKETGDTYKFNDTILCHDPEEEAVCIWHDDRHVDTVRCDSHTYKAMLSRFEKTETYIPLVNPFKMKDSSGREWSLIKGYISLDGKKTSLKNLRFELDGDRVDVYDGKEFLLTALYPDSDALMREKTTHTQHLSLTVKRARIGADAAEYDGGIEEGEIMITTESSVNLPIESRLGIITAEAAYGMNIIKDIRTLWSDKLGGRNRAIQSTLKEARTAVLNELKEEAKVLGGHAVIAIDLDYSEFSGAGKSMMFCVGSGTVVRFKRKMG